MLDTVYDRVESLANGLEAHCRAIAVQMRDQFTFLFMTNSSCMYLLTLRIFLLTLFQKDFISQYTSMRRKRSEVASEEESIDYESYSGSEQEVTLNILERQPRVTAGM